MKNLTSLFLVFFAVILVSTGCKKKHDDTTPAKTKTQLITQGTWKFSSATSGGIDISGFLQSCQKDNTLTFQTNGTGTIDEGASKCNAGDPQSNPFTWNFANSETTLHVSTVLFTSGSNDFTIVTLSETQLIGSQVISGQTVVVTFIHV